VWEAPVHLCGEGMRLAMAGSQGATADGAERNSLPTVMVGWVNVFCASAAVALSRKRAVGTRDGIDGIWKHWHAASGKNESGRAGWGER
jgi:hypothetical protein